MVRSERNLLFRGFQATIFTLQSKLKIKVSGNSNVFENSTFLLTWKLLVKNYFVWLEIHPLLNCKYSQNLPSKYIKLYSESETSIQQSL